MRVDGNTVHKCIHEALDYSWCDCSDETREELQVTLPKPPEMFCESCEEVAAEFTLSVTDSLSMSNLSYCCLECASGVMFDWMDGGDYTDIEGWEIRKLHGN